MKHHAAMIGLAAGLVLMVGAPAVAINSVTVESKTVLPSGMIPIGIAITNDFPLRSITIPLVLREIGSLDSCSYPNYLQASRTAGGRLDGVLFHPSSVINGYPIADGITCKNSWPGGFLTPGNPLLSDGNAPDGVLFSLTSNGVGDYLPGPGADPSPANGSLQVWVNPRPWGGQFEIDTSCVDPTHHLLFVYYQNSFATLPSFTKGVITVQPYDPCLSTGDVNGDFLSPSISDLLALIDFVYFRAPIPMPFYEYHMYQADLNGDGFIDHADIDLYICYYTPGCSSPPQFPVPVPCCPDTVRGCCETIAGKAVRSKANCDLLGGTYQGDGKRCCVPVPKGTELWLLFDEGTPGPSMNGAAPYDGIQHGSLAAVPGAVDGALQFDGATSYVEVPSYSDQNPGTGDFSIDAWVFRDQGGNDGVRTIADKRDNLGGGQYRGYSFYLWNGRLGFHLADGTYTGWNTPVSEALLAGAWYHVAVTVDRDSPTGGRFYINGIQSPATFDPTSYKNSSISSTGPFRVGSVSFAVQSVFLGKIDEVEVFRRSLDATEIQAIYGATDYQNYGKCRCYCPKLGDPNGDGVIDVLDVIELINIAFGGAPDPQDPLCPKTRGDVNNDGVTDVFDVVYIIATAFSGGPMAVDPCNP